MNRLISMLGRFRDALPEPVSRHLRGKKFRYQPVDIPPPPSEPNAPRRLYIGPANYAGQGFGWARCAERLEGVGAVNMQISDGNRFGFPSDDIVPFQVAGFSHSWQRRQFSAVAGFTHVIFESALPLFGNLFGGDIAVEARRLRDRGVAIAMLSHGSDLRLPSRHRELDEWSPFHDLDWPMGSKLEARALAHRKLLQEVQAPVFVATPDLLLDWPGASWLPIVVDPAVWASDATVLTRHRPVVVHAPTSAVLKGSDLVEPTMQRLHDEGVVEYRRIRDVDSSQMPAIYEDADIVLEQFRLGNYATTAIEAMASGRVVVAYVHDQVRDHVRATYGREVPVVQATVDTLEAVLRDIAADRSSYRNLALNGPSFVKDVHDGSASAQVLRPFLFE